MVRPDRNDPRWKRLTGNQCFCTECGEYFTTVGNFERHQRVNEPCREPQSVGLVTDPLGYWRMPGTERPDFTVGNAQLNDSERAMNCASFSNADTQLVLL